MPLQLPDLLSLARFRSQPWHDPLASLIWCAITVPLFQFVSFEEDQAAALIPLVLGGSCLHAGVGVPLRLPIARLVAVLMSIAVCLYAVMLVLLGTEDVGGPLISVPFAVGLLFFATYNFVRGCVANVAPDDAA